MAHRRTSRFKIPLSRVPGTVKSGPEMGGPRGGRSSEAPGGSREEYGLPGVSCGGGSERTALGGWAPGSSSEVPTFSLGQKREGCVLQQLEWK